MDHHDSENAGGGGIISLGLLAVHSTFLLRLATPSDVPSVKAQCHTHQTHIHALMCLNLMCQEGYMPTILVFGRKKSL